MDMHFGKVKNLFWVRETKNDGGWECAFRKSNSGGGHRLRGKREIQSGGGERELLRTVERGKYLAIQKGGIRKGRTTSGSKGKTSRCQSEREN